MSIPADERTLGELVATATKDMSQLVHKEIQLAKTELKEEAVRAGKGLGLVGASAALGLPAALMLLTACALGIDELGLATVWGFVVMGGFCLLLAGALAGLGAKKMVKVRPPERTIQTVRSDLEWARHPTVTRNPDLLGNRTSR